jgi:hypothetical protein
LTCVTPSRASGVNTVSGIRSNEYTPGIKADACKKTRIITKAFTEASTRIICAIKIKRSKLPNSSVVSLQNGFVP